jgi:SAM-dependent MidA family methyltransferase
MMRPQVGRSANTQQTLAPWPGPRPGHAPCPECLPTPSEQALQHSRAVFARIRDEIESNGGAIPFARYMELALYAPGLGYYSAGMRKFGRDGDFVTAPEISPLFSRCVGRQIDQVLDHLGTGEVLEVGAGSGILAAEVLTTLAGSGRLPRHYFILETSAELRERQELTIRAHAPGLMDRVIWLDHLPEPGFCGVMIANEVLDAMPAHRFRVETDAPLEWYIGCEGARLVWKLARPVDTTLTKAVRAIECSLDHRLPAGYASEINTLHRPWVHELGQRMSAGLILLIDYGYPRREYYHAQRNQGTLMCYYRHHAHQDPLVLPGLQDISVHVDFTTIAEAAAESELQVSGFTTQSSFLLSAGLIEMSVGAAPDTPGYWAMTQQIKQLTLPGEMGELVKFMALTRGIDLPLLGFTTGDLRIRL